MKFQRNFKKIVEDVERKKLGKTNKKLQEADDKKTKTWENLELL